MSIFDRQNINWGIAPILFHGFWSRHWKFLADIFN